MSGWEIERDIYFWQKEQLRQFIAQAKADGSYQTAGWEERFKRKKAELAAVEEKIIELLFSGKSVIFSEVSVSEAEVTVKLGGNSMIMGCQETDL